MQSQESNFKYETSEMSLQTPISSGGSLQRPYPLSGSSEAWNNKELRICGSMGAGWDVGQTRNLINN